MGDVAAVDVVVLLEVGQVEDHLVTHAARLARIVGPELRCERGGHVVGVDDCHFRGAAQSGFTQHLDITVGYGQQQCGAPRSRCHGGDAFVAARRHNRMRGEEGFEVLGDADRTHARTAAAVGHGEGLVQVEVADVGADVARIGQAHLCVHIGAVHVDLSARVVYGVHDFADAAFEHPVRRGIGHHQAAQLRTVLLGLDFEVLHVDVAVGVARHGDDLHARHGGRRWVGAVGRCRDQHNVAVALSAALVVGADHHQPGVFARSARVGL